MANNRECGLFIAVGSKGVGKTYTTLGELREYIANDESVGRSARTVLLLDANNEFQSVTAIAYNAMEKDEHKRTAPIRALAGKKGMYRIMPFRIDRRPMTTSEIKVACIDICNHFRKGLLLLEDYNRYINGAEAEELVNMLVTLRHRAVDCFIHLQSASPISTRLWQNLNYLRFHKINDNIDRYKNRIPYELMKICQIAVNNEYMNGNKRVYFYVAVMDEKVVMPIPIFEQACIDYVSQNRGMLKKMKDSLEFKQGKTVKNDTKSILAEFISTMKVKYLTPMS